MDPNLQVPQTQQDPYYPNDSGGGSSSGKKRIAIILLAAIFLLGVISFAIWALLFRGKLTSESEEATLTYWGVWEDVSVLQPVFDEFEREHPKIKIKYEKIDIKSLGDYVDRLKTRTSEGNAPDIIRFHSSWLIQLQDILSPFPEDVVKNTGLEKDYFKVVERDLKKDGAFYGLPLSIDTLALFINTDLLSNIGGQPPSTWNDLDTLSRQLTSIDENGKITTSGVAMGTYDNIAHAPDLISLLLLQNGADFKNLAGSNIESAVSALQFYTLFSQSQALRVWDQMMDNSKIAFSGGKLAMYFGYSWDIFEIKAFNPNLNFQIVPVPVLPGTKATVASYWAEGVSNKTKHPEAAFEFIKFLGQDKTQQMIFESQSKLRGSGSPYAKKNLAELIKDNNEIYPFIARADDAISTFFSSDTYDAGINKEMNTYLGNAVRGVINDNISYKSAIETLGNGVSQILSRYEKPNGN